jgi:hypothetical protein
VKIVLVSMHANEYPVSRAFFAQAQQLFDFGFIISHNSYDNTVSNLPKNCEHIFLESKGYPQSKVVSEFVKRAIIEVGADVVIPLDFDEFLPFKTKADLEEYLLSVPKEFDCIKINWQNLVPFEFSNREMFRNVFYYAHEKSQISKIIVFKDIIKSHPDFQISQGSHTVFSQSSVRFYIENNYRLLHIPIQGTFQFAQKVLLGASVVAEGKLGDQGDHWVRHSFEPFETTENLKNIAFDYGNPPCKFHKNIFESDFDFSHLGSDFIGEFESFAQSIKGNWEKISNGLLKIADTNYFPSAQRVLWIKFISLSKKLFFKCKTLNQDFIRKW